MFCSLLITSLLSKFKKKRKISAIRETSSQQGMNSISTSIPKFNPVNSNNSIPLNILSVIRRVFFSCYSIVLIFFKNSFNFHWTKTTLDCCLDSTVFKFNQIFEIRKKYAKLIIQIGMQMYPLIERSIRFSLLLSGSHLFFHVQFRYRCIPITQIRDTIHIHFAMKIANCTCSELNTDLSKALNVTFIENHFKSPWQKLNTVTIFRYTRYHSK